MIKKLLLGLFGIITIGLVNFGNCGNLTMYLDKQLNFSVCGNESNNFCSGTMYFPCNFDSGDPIEINQFYADSSSSFSCNLDLNIFNSVGNYYGLICFPNGCQDINNFSNGITVITGTFNTGLQTFGTPFAFRDIGVDNSSEGIVSCQSSGFYQGNSFNLFGQLEGFINLQCSINNVETISSLRTKLDSCQNSTGNSGECSTGDIQRSSLYINDIQHLSSENINITIPEEISWNYTGDNQNFDLDIEGYNTDSDYIAGIITTQNSKPSKSDLNYIISSLLPLFVPGLVIILFIYFVFKFIKKAF